MNRMRMSVLTMLTVVLAFLPACDNSDRSSFSAEHPDAPASVARDAARATQQVEKALQQVMKHQDDPTPVIERARREAKDFPQYAPAQAILGKALLYDNRVEPALEALERSLQLKPEQPGLHSIAGTLWMSREEPRRAQRHYEAAVDLSPNRATYHLQLARALMARRRWDRAEAESRRALRLNSSLPIGHAALSAIFARQGELIPAIQQIRRARELARDDEAGSLTYARREADLLRQADRPIEALRSLRSLPAKQQIKPAVLEAMASCYAMRGHPEVAGGMYENVLRIRPTDAAAAAASARWYLQADHPDDAHRMIRRLHAIAPRDRRLSSLRQRLAEGRES